LRLSNGEEKMQLDEIHKDIKELVKVVHRIELQHANKITKLETKQNTIVKISTMLFSALLAGVVQLFGMLK